MAMHAAQRNKAVRNLRSARLTMYRATVCHRKHSFTEELQSHKEEQLIQRQSMQHRERELLSRMILIATKCSYSGENKHNMLTA